ncbi:hypothetical protein PINS_up007142 [Pythium insidiosum]|nr:hypothetical protein PINS_up007142 [Pythium insidiosum]
MYQHKRFGIITHQGCAQFTADVLAQNPQITTREAIGGASGSVQLNRPGTFHVTVHRAVDLPGLQLLGTQAPYAKLSLLPWKEPSQTKPAENGGRTPMWKSMHDNMMAFPHMYNSTITPIPLLEVEIWNSNYLADDMVACTLLDMTPLLRYPNVEVKRWFTLSSRSQPAIALMAHPQGQPRVLLSIKFVPLEGKHIAGNEHKFRVHQLKSVGLAIPVCAACDRVIVNVLKGVWGYRCEICGIDVHKACIMKAVAKCECKRQRSNSSVPDNGQVGSGSGGTLNGSNEALSVDPDDEKPAVWITKRGAKYKLLNDDVTNEVGRLFINMEGIHLCTKQCQPTVNLHAKNIFEGDTYCRLQIENVTYETSPVLKSADPMYMERVCIKIRRRNATLKLELIDFNSDAPIGELQAPLFQLLQREADDFVHKNPLMNKIRGVLYSLNLEEDGSEESLPFAVPTLSQFDRYALKVSDKRSQTKRRVGHALVNLVYLESKRDMVRSRLQDELGAEEVDDSEFSVESLKATIDRLGRTIRKFQWIEAEYHDIIAWKNKKKSSVCFTFFVVSCICVNLEYIGAYILFGVGIYMLYQLHFRLEGKYEERWIDYIEYDQQLTDRLKLHRPIADLYVAVHEAKLSDATEQHLMASQALLKDLGGSKQVMYVRVKYLPNDKNRSELSGDTMLIPSPFSEAIVGWTHGVEKSKCPTWKKPPAASKRGRTNATCATCPETEEGVPISEFQCVVEA